MSDTGAVQRVIDERVTVAMLDGVAHVSLARAEKMNALDRRMFEALVAASELASASAVRAVVLSGVGKAFCAGIDLGDLVAIASEEGRAAMAARSHGITNLYQQAAMAWRDLPVPVIAAIHGMKFGEDCRSRLGLICASARQTRSYL